MLKISILLLILSSFVSKLYSQKISISGYIKDATSGESLIGSNVLVDSTQTGTSANQYGFFSLTLPKGSHSLTFSYIGYSNTKVKGDFVRDSLIQVTLEPSIALKGIEVIANQTNTGTQSSRMSTIVVPISQLKKLPSLLGEADVLKTIQLLPGVQSGNEGTSGFYVRGGGADQNMILLDGVPVYNANHLFGFFSVFNPDAINSIELVKGGFPARYGGRLSSVLDIRMKEGNMKKIKVNGSIGIIASKLTIEGPIIKDKTSFLVSGRRTYLDYLARPISNSINHSYGQKAGYYFADVNAKINHIFSSKDRLFLSMYAGNDKFYQISPTQQYLYDGVIYEQSGSSKLGWGNLTSSLRWAHNFTGKLFGNTTLTYSNYKFKVSEKALNYDITATPAIQVSSSQEYYSGIKDLAAHFDLDFIPNTSHYIKAGIGFTSHLFSPGVTQNRLQSGDKPAENTKIGHENIQAGEFSSYIEDDYLISSKFKLNAGLHFSGFILTDKNYFSLQPRLSARYLISPKLSLKTSYSYMSQYIHLLTNSNIGLPTDLWVPATSKVPPLNSNQFSVGFTYDLPLGLNFTIESYYKTMNNVIEYKEGASFLANYENWESKVEIGKGWAYGTEFFLEKRNGTFTGWIGYTWSKSERKFPSINEGRVFPYKFDRRHDISVVASYKLNDSWDMSFTWVYGTGNAITMPTVEYLVVDDYGNTYPVQSYKDRNSFRTAAYHRLDLGFNHTKEKKWGTQTWSLGLYNAYNRKNPFYYMLSTDGEGRKVLERVSLFPVIPSISYSFKIGK